MSKPCPACRGENHPHAQKCRHCGHHIERRGFTIILVIAAIVAFLYWVTTEDGINTIVSYDSHKTQVDESPYPHSPYPYQSADKPADLDENGCSPTEAAKVGLKCE
jgi:hypothetical protein